MGEILAAHRRSLGLDASERIPDLAWRLRTEHKGRIFSVGILVRSEPFGYHEASRREDRPGILRWVSDGRHAWTPAVPRGIPLRDGPARGCLERAFNYGFLYLDPGRFRNRSGVDPSGTLPAFPHQPESLESGQRVHRIHYRTRAGSLLQLHFDAENGRLLAMVDPGVARKWVRFADWKKFGRLTVPTLRLRGRFDRPGITTQRVENLESDVSHDPALFSGHPLPPLPPLQEGGSLRLLKDPLPGSGVLLLEGVRLNGRAIGPAFVDTGAQDCNILKSLADELELPNAERVVMKTLAGIGFLNGDWVDSLSHGNRTDLQLTALESLLPRVFQLPEKDQPRFLLGGAELFSDSPVFDLERKRLFLRGKPVTPMEELDLIRGREVIHVPYERRRAGPGPVQVEIEMNGRRTSALFDTGFPGLLRLTPAGLELLGFPGTRRWWRSRAAGSVKVQGVLGEIREDFFLRLPGFRLGPVVFVDPMIAVEDPGGPPVENRSGVRNARRGYTVLVGGGLLRHFIRVGIDRQRKRLELQPASHLRKAPDGRWFAPALDR